MNESHIGPLVALARLCLALPVFGFDHACIPAMSLVF